MAKARPRSEPAAVVAEPPAAGSGAVDPARSRAVGGLLDLHGDRAAQLGVVGHGASATASASRASLASLSAGSVRRRQASRADFRLRETIKRMTRPMRSTRTTMTAMRPQGVLEDVVVTGAVVVVVVGGVVVVVGTSWWSSRSWWWWSTRSWWWRTVVVVVSGTVVVVVDQDRTVGPRSGRHRGGRGRVAGQAQWR